MNHTACACAQKTHTPPVRRLWAYREDRKSSKRKKKEHEKNKYHIHASANLEGTLAEILEFLKVSVARKHGASVVSHCWVVVVVAWLSRWWIEDDEC
jgi:hypothetical protein